MNLERRTRLVALGELHEQWVAGNVATAADRFDPPDQPGHADYNQHHADLDADGAAQDEFDRLALEITHGWAETPQQRRGKPHRRPNLTRHLKGMHPQYKHGRKKKFGVPNPSTSAPAMATPADRPTKTFKVHVEDALLKVVGKDESGETEYEAYELDAGVVADIRDAFTIEYGGLATADIEVMPSFEAWMPGTFVTGSILDASDMKVGVFTRRIFEDDEDGKLKVEHTKLSINPEFQGQGFAQAFNAQMFDWYRRGQVREVQLTANIDVGGYAWARAGYDWRDQYTVHQLIRDISRKLAEGDDDRIPVERRAEQRKLAEHLLDTMSDTRFSDDSFPTPFEVSQLGRWPGAGRGDWWIGKVLLMGSEWEAVTSP